MGIPRWMRIRGMFFWAREKKRARAPGSRGRRATVWAKWCYINDFMRRRCLRVGKQVRVAEMLNHDNRAHGHV